MGTLPRQTGGSPNLSHETGGPEGLGSGVLEQEGLLSRVGRAVRQSMPLPNHDRPNDDA